MILDLHMRPTVCFDSANHEHRKWFSDFQKNRTWGRCPVRFAVPGDSSGGDLVATIQKTLLAYYVSKEFVAPRAPRKQKVKTS
jgi:hypothetical protein